MSLADVGVFELENESKLSRRERDERPRLRNILSVALRLVLDTGFSEFSMRQLAEATDYSRAALYKYFPCKEEVVIALAIESLHRRAQLYRMVPDFDESTLERVVVNRARRVQPLQVRDFSRLVPKVETRHPRFFVLNSAQFVNGTLNNNQVVRAVDELAARLADPPTGEAADVG